MAEPPGTRVNAGLRQSCPNGWAGERHRRVRGGKFRSTGVQACTSAGGAARSLRGSPLSTRAPARVGGLGSTAVPAPSTALRQQLSRLSGERKVLARGGDDRATLRPGGCPAPPTGAGPVSAARTTATSRTSTRTPPRTADTDYLPGLTVPPVRFYASSGPWRFPMPWQPRPAEHARDNATSPAANATQDPPTSTLPPHSQSAHLLCVMPIDACKGSRRHGSSTSVPSGTTGAQDSAACPRAPQPGWQPWPAGLAPVPQT
ncbi:hypothetical protein CFP65_4548 [Kitasatospora sp. MMS16-BH015]|nr:hypothetical protein CFP65_4548 [Kitasatospora sp. MMS16-BH015]